MVGMLEAKFEYFYTIRWRAEYETCHKGLDIVFGSNMNQLELYGLS